MQDFPTVKALLFMKGYSERVPRKNVRLLSGRPLLHWILGALTESRYVEEIVLNTDDEEIAEKATQDFDVTIHWRPDYLLRINSNEASQIMAYDLSIMEGEHFLQTHSTNPLVTTATIDRAVETYFENSERCDSLFSVTPIQKRFYWPNGQPINHDPNNMVKTQELPFLYEENSCIYVFSRRVFEQFGNRFGASPYLFPMDPVEAVDIDETIDFSVAEALMNDRLQENEGR